MNTPRAVSSSTAVVWRWNNTNAYGYNAANETISGVTFEYNPRFAGQYFDKETGLHYNYHRMYNPELARYMQPDPIGVNGGMNIYSYVENNPLNANDPFGLIQRDASGAIKFFTNKNTQRIEVAPNRFAYYQVGHILTDLGTKIEAMKYIGKYEGKLGIINNYTTDCHGVSFADGQLWIDNQEVTKILADEYIQVSEQDKKYRDVAIRYNNEGKIIHSMLINEILGIHIAYEKNGISPGPVNTIPVNWYSDLKFYRKK